MRLYVGNLPYESDAEELRNLFAAYGDVSEVVVPTDRETGRSRGFAFVDMAASEEAEAAMEALDSSPLNGRTIRVNEARPREQRDSGPRW